MDTSLKKERIKWALVFLIGLLVSFIITEWDENDKKNNNLTHSKNAKPEDSVRQRDHIIHKLLPSISKQPQELFSY